jgi:hypothetical protein
MSKDGKHEHKPDHGGHKPPPTPPTPPADTGDVEQTIDNDATVTVTNTQTVTGVDLDVTATDYGKIELKHVDITSWVWAKQANDTEVTVTQGGTNSVEGAPSGDVAQTIDNDATVTVSNTQTVTGVDLDFTASGHGSVKVYGLDIYSDVAAYQGNDTAIDINQGGTNEYAFA